MERKNPESAPRETPHGPPARERCYGQGSMSAELELARCQCNEADAAVGDDGHRTRQRGAKRRRRDHGYRRSRGIRCDKFGQMLQPFLGMTLGIGFEDQDFAR
jgi:hypothetical protein